MNWSLRIRTVLAGSALASIKFDTEADEIATCLHLVSSQLHREYKACFDETKAASTYRKAQNTWRWGRFCVFLVHRQVFVPRRRQFVS